MASWIICVYSFAKTNYRMALPIGESPERAGLLNSHCFSKKQTANLEFLSNAEASVARVKKWAIHERTLF